TYYSVTDFLADKGLPANAVNDFLEEKGLPAFPVVLSIIVLLIGAGLLFANFSQGVNQTVNLNLVDELGKPLQGVKLSIQTASGQIIQEIEKNDGTSVVLEKRKPGEQIVIFASKEGYQQTQAQVLVDGKIPTNTYLKLSKADRGGITAKITLTDNESQGNVSRENVLATTSWGTGTEKTSRIATYNEKEGVWEFQGIPQGTEIILEVTANNYESFKGLKTFSNETPLEISLTPKPTVSGETSKITVNILDSETLEDLTDVKIIVIQNDLKEFANTISNSPYAIELPKDVSVKFAFEKEGYQRYSGIAFETFREDKELSYTLEKGGTKLRVTVLDQLSNTISNAQVQLFSVGSEQIGETKTTGFEGFIEFEKLDPEQIYFVTVFEPSFLPKRIKVDMKEQTEVQAKLDALTSTNSNTLLVKVVDEKEIPVSNAALEFFEEVDGTQ
ncbi:MAG: hypothetical protein Q7K42_04660, partial [Candidatus Diapherotrites archaeon]|nr:hypothetical protein [Candidatus Diapherotrites archaeon]